MTIQFKRAVRAQAKIRLALTGPSGSGKTYGALLIAQGLGGKIAVIDTERNSASLYSHVAVFDTLDLAPPYTPERFIEAIKAAEAAGYATVIIDSLTHEWAGVGGCLEMVDAIAAARYRGNSWSAWNEVTPRHRALIDAMLQSKCHIIATMRSKTETAQTDTGGKKQVVKLGMKAEQREGAEYEFTVVLDIAHGGHFATPSKDRTGLFSATRDPEIITPDTGRRILQWLESGATPEPAARAQTNNNPARAPSKEDVMLMAIDAAPDMAVLREAYEAGVTMAETNNDAELMQAVVARKNARRKALLAAAPPAPTPDPDPTDDIPK